MRLQNILFAPNGRRYILVMSFIAGSFIFPQVSQLAYAHTFSTSESAEFLSLVDQIKAEAALAVMNLQANNNNATTLAQAHAQKASTLLLVDNNDTLGEIREVNNRIANSLESDLKQLEGNVTALTAASSTSTFQGQMPPQEGIMSINQTVQSLDDTLDEAVSARIERTQQDNATTWAMSLADLVNVVLSDYGNATGASFDLTDMSNMASMGGMARGMQMNDNNSNMNMSGSQVQMSSISNSTSDNNTMTMKMTDNSAAGSANSSSMSNATTTTITTIVDTAAYQSAQYLANNTILQLFNDKLKPLTISSNGILVNNNNNTSTNTTTAPMTEQGQNNNTSPNASNSDNNTMSNIDKLETGLVQLKDGINHNATPQEVMIIAHTNIHPLIMQVYGLTLEQAEGEGHTDHDES